MKEQKTGVREVEISIWNRRVGLIARQIKEKTEIEKVKTIEIFKLNWQINKLKKLLTELPSPRLCEIDPLETIISSNSVITSLLKLIVPGKGYFIVRGDTQNDYTDDFYKMIDECMEKLNQFYTENNNETYSVTTETGQKKYPFGEISPVLYKFFRDHGVFVKYLD